MIPAKVREVVYKRDGKCCIRCGLFAYGGSLHHRVNASQGGESTPTNLVLLCGSGTTGCHGWVTTHPTDARRDGLSLASWQKPAEVPVVWRGAPVYLTAYGSLVPEQMGGDAA